MEDFKNLIYQQFLPGRKANEFNEHCKRSVDLVLRNILSRNNLNPVGLMGIFCKSFFSKYSFDKVEEEKENERKFAMLTKKIQDEWVPDIVIQESVRVKSHARSRSIILNKTRTSQEFFKTAGQTKLYKKFTDYF